MVVVVVVVLPMQCYASLGTSYGPVSVCLCPSVTSQSPIETAESGWFLARELHCVIRKFGQLQKQEYFPLQLCPTLYAQSVINWTIVSELS